jgi:PAS domain-containing protein
VDAQGKKSFQNQRAVEVLKIPQSLADDPDDRAQLRWVADRAKNPGQFLERVTYLFSHPDEISSDELEFQDGTILDRYTAPVVGKGGKYFGRIWIFRDITGRRRIEKALRESEARHRAPIQPCVVSSDILMLSC